MMRVIGNQLASPCSSPSPAREVLGSDEGEPGTHADDAEELE